MSTTSMVSQDNTTSPPRNKTRDDNFHTKAHLNLQCVRIRHHHHADKHARPQAKRSHQSTLALASSPLQHHRHQSHLHARTVHRRGKARNSTRHLSLTNYVPVPLCMCVVHMMHMNFTNIIAGPRRHARQHAQLPTSSPMSQLRCLTAVSISP